MSQVPFFDRRTAHIRSPRARAVLQILLTSGPDPSELGMSRSQWERGLRWLARTRNRPLLSQPVLNLVAAAQVHSSRVRHG